ncbi:diguanylate cyclase (GGDEF)-like protein [Sphingopyxis sp. BE259]|jgi:diguanylate cyclase|uniref:sensor domain-containing diguanylate cyclase n=2 Tax=unclassified Sphingopyxis TaxID=2614943 RepID=UPI00285E251F|nr:diguanylate cyclase [Sphingopyxis sp. BE122]MDR6832952.1 diguanylate cyclase (GGDEF)-like protein [Sphingopyxis sp. BE122]MDR7228695.1 diguanylate cyclase (GGDEF)-like protein [Sphingopyxis sp. BE259]
MVGAALLGAAAPARAQSSFADATSMTWDGVLTGVFLGLLLFSLAYNAAFFGLLRERFLIWQSARTFCYFALAVALSPLAMGPWLTPDSFARQVWITIFFDLSLVVSGVFLRSYLEPGMIGPRLYRWLGWPPVLILLTTPATLVPDASGYMMLRSIMLVAMLALAATTVVIALKRGSRTARYQAAAWSGIGGVYGVSLFHDLVLGEPFASFLFLLFPALGLEVMLTAFGILDRLMRLRRERQEARAQAEAMRIIAHTDPLTGLPNRRAIEESFNDEPPVAIALVDLDHFKSINDHHGHDVGDRVIFAAGVALGSGSALAARVGGEEFALLFRGAPAAVAIEADRLRQRIGAYVKQMVPLLERPVTASMGLVHIGRNTSFGAAMKSADINLYAAKESGRNRVVFIEAA